MHEYRRYEGESEDALIYRVCKDKDVIGTWEDVRDILNDLLRVEYNESTYRKKFTAFEKMYEAKFDETADTDAQIVELKQQIRELKKERAKLQTEKLEYNRWLRENARDELITEKIVNAIANLDPMDSPTYIEPSQGSREYVLLFGDEHYGAEFEIKGLMGDVINSYSPEIFEQRMNELFRQVVKIIKDRGITNLHLHLLGDAIAGLLRPSQLVHLRYGVVDSTIKYANFISDWIHNLSYYTSIELHMTDGNHSELRFFNQPKGSFTDENMGKVIREFVKTKLSNNPNVRFVVNESGIILDKVSEYTVVSVHGEYKDMKDAIDGLQNIYNVPIDYLCAGHLHHYNAEDIGVQRAIIRVPSIIGIDPYAAKLLKGCSPAALLLTFEENKGRVAEDFLVLD